MHNQKVLILLIGIFFISCYADIYLHNPRGGNNRNCEPNTNRNNANRLWDSQNNDAGGYPCPRALYNASKIDNPRMYYYSGSQLQIEWTNQHACGDNDEVNCDVVLQYMCEADSYGMRDGTPKSANDAATNTIPFSTTSGPNYLPNYGQHEDFFYYQACQTRTRNQGLFLADQTLSGNTAIYTRQNPNNNNNRYGLECPEERDYYPYWHPTPWKDIAVFTKNTSRCQWYQQNSQNTLNKGQCVNSQKVPQSQNSYETCTSAGNTWETTGAFNIPPPECLEAPWGRINHLGNTKSGYMPSYNWTIPYGNFNTCVLRIRYNVSTGGFPQEDGAGRPFVDYKNNGANSPVKNRPYFQFDNDGRYLALAINTNQYFRTFQDRTYVFAIKPRPSNIPDDAAIYNLNVRGKRGDIVSVYPSVEYDFVPHDLVVNKSDYIHFQWTGSDYCVASAPNDGEGGPNFNGQAYSGSDRSNIVEMPILNSNIPFNISDLQGRTMFVTSSGEPDIATITRFAYVDQDPSSCLTLAELSAIKTNADFVPQNCFKLNAAPNGPYFDGGLIQMNQNGTFTYMCTRNNDFSNRDQKGKITVNLVAQPPHNSSSHGGIGGGWIAFIVFVCLFVGAVAAAGIFVYRKTKKEETASRHYVVDLNENLLA